jgi:ribosomal protein L37E
MEIKKELKKIPEGCIEIPLEEVDYIYQSSQSHTPVIVMKQKLSPTQSRVLECMRCGSKKNLNTNKDKSFVECDECMWGNDKSEKQEEWREKIKQMVLTDCFKDQPDIQRYIDFIEQLLSEREKELLEWVISEEDIPQNVSSLWASLRWFEIYKEAHKRLSKLLKEENEEKN